MCDRDNPKKKKNSDQKFRPEYSAKWPCLRASEKSPYEAFCTTCESTFHVNHGGKFDCSRHIKSDRHNKNNERKTKVNKMPDTFFVESDLSISITKAEMLFSSFIIEHNVSLSAADHAGYLFKAMFPDSKIAKQYASARTKTTAILKCMANKTCHDIVTILKRMPFSLSTDGSTDQNAVKLYPILVRYFDESKQKIQCALLSLKECSDNSGEGIFSMLNQEIDDKDLNWKNCVAFGCDNARTMLGHLNGVVSHLKKANPNLYVQGCLCHLLHICAQKAAKRLHCDVESLLVDIYYYLDKSSKRKKILIDCQKACGLEPYKILKFVSTRWLSLLEAINRLLSQWNAIVEFFSSDLEFKQNAKFRNIKKVILSPDTKLYLLFLEAVLPIFTTLNVKLQSDVPQIHLVRRYLNSFFMDLLVRFLQPSAISSFSSSDITKIDFLKSSHQKLDEDLVIGAKTKAYLGESNISEEVKKKFFHSVRKFYEAACTYAVKSLPLTSDILSHAEIADPSLRAQVSFSSVMFFTDRFCDSISYNDLDAVEMEFSKYQIDPLSDDILSCNADVAWSKILEIKDPNGSIKYQFLPKIMLTILLIPHSNAASERVFSIVRHNLTEFRSCLNIETLNALLTEKVSFLSNNECCYKRKFSKEEIVNAKKATVQYLKN